MNSRVVALLVACCLLPAEAAAQKLYYVIDHPSDESLNMVRRANLDGSAIQDIVRPTVGLQYPMGIAVDAANGKIYFGGGASAGLLQRANLDGSNVTTLVDLRSVGAAVSSIAIDARRGKIYWTDAGRNYVQRADLATGANVQTLAQTTNSAGLCGIALDLVNDKVYWADQVNRIFRANLDGSSQQVLISNRTNAFAIALDAAAGLMYFADYGTGQILRANLDGTNVQQVIGGLGDAVDALALDASAGILYFASYSGGGVRKVNVNGTGLADVVPPFPGALTTGVALLPALPAATTTAATAISTTGATLNGTVDPRGQAASVSFEYGTTLGYGTTVAATPGSVSGSVSTAVSRAITGLTPNTTYHYRVLVQAANGPTWGADQVFTTAAVAPSATTGAATAVTGTAATLQGTVNPNYAATTVIFELGTTTAYGTTLAASPGTVTGASATAVTASASGLVPNTTYHFRVVALSSGGVTQGTDQTFVTAAVSPVAVTGTATAVTASSATLGGTVTANNASTTVRFEFGLTAAYGSTATATPSPVNGMSPTAVSAVLGALLPNATYHYRVAASNSAGGAFGVDRTFVTAAVPPSIATGAASALTPTGATLSAVVNAQNAATTSGFEFGTTPAYGFSVAASPSPVSGMSDATVSAAVSGLQPNTTYHYRAFAQNAAGTVYGSDLTFATGALPPAVTTLAAGGVTGTEAVLNGRVVAQNASTVAGFEYGLTTAYGTTVNANPRPVEGMQPAAVSAAIAGLAPNSTYHYRLLAQNLAGTSYGGDLTFSTALVPPTAATADATGVGPDTATLHAVVNARNAATTVSFEYGPTTAYGASVAAAPSPVDGLADTSVATTLAGLVPNTTYHFRAVAVSAAGTVRGEDRTFTTPAIAPTVTNAGASAVTGTGATLGGSVDAHNAPTTATFEYGLTTAYGTAVAAAPSPVSGTSPTLVSAALTGLIPNATYHFRLVAQNAAGSSASTDQTFTTAAILPSPTTAAATGVSGTGATLNASVNANNASTDVSFEYGPSASYGATVVAAPARVDGTAAAAVSATLAGLVPNTTYHFRVVAQNTAGIARGADLTFTTPAVAPVAETLAATSVAGTAATLHGSVNARNASTTVSFEYGPTAAYGSTVAALPSPVTGTADAPVSAALSGLVPNTTYHFRIVAESAGGVARGADATFATPAVLPLLTTLDASAVTGRGASLHATANANNDSTEVSFEFGTTTAYGTIVRAVPGTVTGTSDTALTAALTGLVPNTGYHFRAFGQNSAGTARGQDKAFTTPAVAPDAATLAATGVTAAGATVLGTVNANNDATAVTFEYGLTDAYGMSVAATPAQVSGVVDTSVQGQLSGLAPATTYHFRVVAQNSAGTSRGADQTFTTEPAPPLATTEPATGITFGAATVAATVNARNSATTVKFEYGLTDAYGTSVDATPGTVSGASDTAATATLSGLLPNTTYHYRVTATNVAGTTPGADRTFTTAAALPVVTTGTATAVSVTGATLAAIVNPGNAPTTVTFEYGTGTSYLGSVPIDQGTVDGLNDVAVTASLLALQPNTAYHYRVVATNAAGTANGADEALLTLPLAPAAVTENATGVGQTTATLGGLVNPQGVAATVEFEWGPTAAYGSTVAAAESPIAAAVSDTAVSAALTGLDPNATYHFRVVAKSTGGTTIGDDRSFATVAAPPVAETRVATGITGTGAVLAGMVNARNSSTQVTFEYGPTVAYGSSIAASAAVLGTADTDVSVAVGGLLPNTTYHFRVVAQNAAGSAAGADQAFTTGKLAPVARTDEATELGPRAATLNGAVTAMNSQTTVTFEYGPTTAYGSTAAATPSPFGGIVETKVSSALTGLSPRTEYHVRVVARSEAGESFGEDRTFTTPPLPLAVATTGAATDVTATAAVLNGTVDPNGSETTVRFEYGPTAEYGQSVDAEGGPVTGDVEVAASKALSGLAPETTYHFRIVAESAAGTVEGEDATFTTAIEAGVCVIAGVRYDDGAENPANPCEHCAPGLDRSRWSSREAGYACADDGLACTADTCDGAGACQHALNGGCLIAGTCVATGALDPANDCRACDPNLAQGDYATRADGSVCADDGFAETVDLCSAGTCTHPPAPAESAAESSGCGCGASGAPAPWGLLGVVLGAALARRRKART